MLPAGGWILSYNFVVFLYFKGGIPFWSLKSLLKYAALEKPISWEISSMESSVLVSSSTDFSILLLFMYSFTVQL